MLKSISLSAHSMKKILFISILLVVMRLFHKYNHVPIQPENIQNIHDCIYSSYPIRVNIKNFIINYIEHSGEQCVNPGFPSIHIQSKLPCDGWLHIIHSDNKYLSSKPNGEFIDASPTLFPFYTLEKDFYDAPYWFYTFFYKPLFYWKGHAYAVQINHEQKIITVVGGIEWGFTFSIFAFKPQTIRPRELSKIELSQDLKVFSSIFQKPTKYSIKFSY